jgi:integrase
MPEQLRLFGGGVIDIQDLRRERETLAAAGRAASTRRAYASDWRDWERWCREAGRGPLPASADSMTLYVVDLSRRRAVATIERRLCAIAAAHLAVGKASPINADVREVMAAIRRRLGTAQACKDALTVPDLVAMVAALPKGPRGLRDRCVLVLGLASGLRRSELAALQLADIEVREAGLVVRIGRSKTDQEGAGREVGIHRGKRAGTDPARAFERWRAVRGTWAGPLFCPVRFYGEIVERGISPTAIARIVQRAAAAAGLDPTRYAGHSLRAGCATVAAERGASEGAIMARTGHRSARMVRRYIRHGSLFSVDPLAGAL